MSPARSTRHELALGHRLRGACPECHADLVLRYSPRTTKKFYGCARYPACRGAHGAHPDGHPLGIPVDAATRQARIAAHEAFDKLWQPPDSFITRAEAYAWLRGNFYWLDPEDVHIGRFDRDQCELVADYAGQYLEDLRRRRAGVTR